MCHLPPGRAIETSAPSPGRWRWAEDKIDAAAEDASLDAAVARAVHAADDAHRAALPKNRHATAAASLPSGARELERRLGAAAARDIAALQVSRADVTYEDCVP